METKTHTTTDPALLNTPAVQGALATAKRSIRLYGALGAVALAVVVAVTGSGHPVNGFMWVRAVLLPLISLLIHRIAGSAAGGSGRAFERLSGLTVVMPIAIIGVDFIPGVCPPWYAVMQTVCMLPVIRVAFLTRGAALRAAFPQGR